MEPSHLVRRTLPKLRKTDAREFGAVSLLWTWKTVGLSNRKSPRCIPNIWLVDCRLLVPHPDRCLRRLHGFGIEQQWLTYSGPGDEHRIHR